MSWAGGRGSDAGGTTRARRFSHAAWRPTLGAWIEGAGVRFRVWAPHARTVNVVFEPPGPAPVTLERFPDGTFGAWVQGVAPGARYRYQLDGGLALPDPASRFQPDGVHGPSQVIDPPRVRWAMRHCGFARMPRTGRLSWLSFR
ncbi:MAG: hypothetical protein AB7I50_19400 [Vicinamibacterales bacterium]